MLKHLTNKTKRYLINFIEIQLIITLISLPILILWGIPISKLSFIGNLIFLPIFTLFLILSSIVFFTHIFKIPNQIFIRALEKITNLWSKLLNLGKKEWLLGFSKTNIILILVIPFLVLVILFNKKINTKFKRVISLSTLLLLFILFSKISENFYKNKKIIFDENIEITKINGKITIKENGLFSKKQSIEKFIEFKLKPVILKNFGTLNIKNLFISKPGIRSFKGAIYCSKAFNLKQVTIPIFNNKLNKYAWKIFFELKKLLKLNNIKFKRIK